MPRDMEDLKWRGEGSWEVVVAIILSLQSNIGASVTRSKLGVPYGKYGLSSEYRLRDAINIAEDMSFIKTGQGIGVGYEWVAWSDYTVGLWTQCKGDELLFFASLRVVRIVHRCQLASGNRSVLRSLVGISFKKRNISHHADCKKAIAKAKESGGVVETADGQGLEWVQHPLLLGGSATPAGNNNNDAVGSIYDDNDHHADGDLSNDGDDDDGDDDPHEMDILHYAKEDITWKGCTNTLAITLPSVVRRRMELHEASWKNRRLGTWLTTLFNDTTGKNWLPLGVFSGSVDRIPNVDDPEEVISSELKALLLGCVWYYPVPIGEGSASNVFLGIDPIGRPVAVKKFKHDALKTSNIRNDGIFSEALRLASQSEVHAGLVKYISHAHWTSKVDGDELHQYALVTELMNMSLHDLSLLWREKNCTSKQLAEVIPQIALQLIATVRDFHTVCDSNGSTMTHNDLNTMNIMIDCRGIVRIIDVGISHYKREEVKTFTAVPSNLAPYFRAPEVVEALSSNNTSGFSKESDVFSIGCVLQELAQLRNPNAPNVTQVPLHLPQSPLMEYHQEHSDVPVTHHQWCLADLVRRCKSFKPAMRPSCDQLMTHPLMWSTEKCIAFLSHFVNPFLPVNNNPTSTEYVDLSKYFKNREEGSTHSTTPFKAKLTRAEWAAAAGTTQANILNDDDVGYVLPSAYFLKTKRNKYDTWLSEFDSVDSPLKLKNFYTSIPTQFKNYNRFDNVFDLLRLINNHSSFHHKPHYDYDALLAAFPYLVIDIYDIALSFKDTWGVGVHEFINPKYDAKKEKH